VDARGKPARALQVGLAHAHEEVGLLALEAVGLAARGALASIRLGGIEVEEERRIRLQARVHQLLERLDHAGGHAAAAALVGVGGVAEAVADDPRARAQRGLDERAHVVAPRGEHHQRLGDAFHGMVQDQLAQLLRRGRAAGLARAHDLHAALGDALAEERQVRGLPRPVDALHRQECAACAHCPSWNLATARLCSSSERENSWVPSPRPTK
jgi:hypothetical protein